MPGTAAKVRLSEKQLAVLEELSRSRTMARAIVQRASIILLGFQGLLNQQIAVDVGLNRQQVGVWRQRWREAWEALCVWECTEPHRLREGILEVLSDAPRPGSPGTFTAEQVAAILAVACESPKLSDREATSLQAIERNAPDKPARPGSVTKQEFEYTRHGTTTLTAGLDVVTGQVVSPTLEATRTEPEFVAHIARTVDLDPTGEWTFIVDNLNTHASESLVIWVAEQCGLSDPLGKKTCAASWNR
jgi:hypothetical protein